MSELSRAESYAVQAFNELLQADDAASSQPLSPAATVSDDLVAETDPYPDGTELNEAAYSQHHMMLMQNWGMWWGKHQAAPASYDDYEELGAASVIALSSASDDDDYAELGDVVGQVCVVLATMRQL